MLPEKATAGLLHLSHLSGFTHPSNYSLGRSPYLGTMQDPCLGTLKKYDMALLSSSQSLQHLDIVTSHEYQRR